MKIAFVYDVAYPWHVGGVETTTFSEAKELAKDHDVDFFTMQWPGMKQEFSYEGIKYHAKTAVDQSKLYRHGRRSMREAFFFSFGLTRLFNHKFDVVIANYFPIVDIPIIYLYCKLKGAKFVMEVVEVWDRNYWNGYVGGVLGGLASAYSNFVLKLADYYICNSSATAASVIKAGVRKEKVKTYCPVIDDELLETVAKEKYGKREDRIIFSGRLIKEKRLDKWLDVVGAVNRKRKGVKALLIGEGPEKAHVETLIKQGNLEDVVKMVPFYKKKREFYKALKQSAVTLNMSEREGLSIISMESVALGTPVVIPESSPIPPEIKQMCMVENESWIPDAIIGIMKAKDKSTYVKDTKVLRNFSTSRIKEVFSQVFAELGLD